MTFERGRRNHKLYGQKTAPTYLLNVTVGEGLEMPVEGARRTKIGLNERKVGVEASTDQWVLLSITMRI